MYKNIKTDIIILDEDYKTCRSDTMDRRVKRTINSIENAFIHLLKSYNLEDITIQQIADEADINRATFYKYYQDKYDLLNRLEDQEIQRLKSKIDYEKLRQPNIKGEDDLRQLLQGVPESVIQLISNNIEIYQVLFSMKRLSLIEDKLSEMITRNLMTILQKKSNINNIPFRYFHIFISGAMISTIKFWVLDPNRVSEDELGNLLYTLMRTGPLKQLVIELSKNPLNRYMEN